MADSLWRHSDIGFNPRYGAIGMFVFPLYLFFELLGPVVELFGYGWFLGLLILGSVNWDFAILFLVVAFLWGALLSVQSLVLDNWSFEMFRGGSNGGLLAAAILENLGYRQMTLVFRIRGLVRFLLGENTWGEMSREGFEHVEERESSPERMELSEESVPESLAEDSSSIVEEARRTASSDGEAVEKEGVRVGRGGEEES
jgi:hypothetical protein